SDQPEDEQQDYRSNRCGDDGIDPEISNRWQMQLTPQPAADESADDADDDVADDAEAAAAHDLAGEPAGDQADDQKNEQTLSFHDGNILPRQRRRPSAVEWALLQRDDIARPRACQRCCPIETAYLRDFLSDFFWRPFAVLCCVAA